MKINNLKTENNIQSKYLDKTLLKKLNINFNKIQKKIKKEINNKFTLNVLDKNFKFNFLVKDFNRFKNFKKIVILGMGGSILGANSIYSFLEEKIRKKFYFFDDINPRKNFLLKKKEKFKDILFLVISKSGHTAETISNLLSLKILKKDAENIIIISEEQQSP